jgi:ferric-dicitrate binding protein FerR (iron transport regulator)
MSATRAPIDATLLAGFQHGDEKALERIFREEYPTLAAEAADASGEPAAAPRIVEGAFVDAWRSHERFLTPDALEDFLRRTVHERAVRDRSRRAAAHRVSAHNGEGAAGGNGHATNGHATNGHATTGHAAGGHAAPASVDEVWAHLATVIHAPPPDAAHAAQVRAEVARHDAAAHVSDIAKPRPWRLTIAAVIAAFALLSVIGWWLDRASLVARVDTAFNSTEVRTLSTQRGQRAELTLLDGTSARLGASSRLIVPPGFEEIRAVKVDGYASFTPAKGIDLPFVARAGLATVRTTDATFDVAARAEDEPAVVRVREGTATATVGDETRTLQAGSALAIGTDGRMTTPSATMMEEAFAWTDGRLAIVNRPLRQVLPMLNDWYRLQIIVPDSSVLSRAATMRASLDSPTDAMAAVESSAGVTIKYEGKLLVLRDGPR